MNTVADLIRGRAQDDKVALMFEEQRWSHREFAEACAQRAAYLLAQRDKASANDEPYHIGIMLDNVPEFPMWLGACALAGATAVGINPTRKGGDLQRDISYTECRIIVTELHYEQDLQCLDLDRSDVRILCTGSEAYNALLQPYASAKPDDPALQVAVTGSDCFCLIFTSGTSGAPKACICSHQRMVSSGQIVVEWQQLGENDVFYVVMPLFHSNSIILGFLPMLISGGAMALRRKFSASGFLPDVRRYGVTFFNYVGKPLAYILATPEQADDGDNSLRQVYGNEAADVDIENFSRRFTCNIVDSYGTTEGGATIMRVNGMPKGALGIPVSQGVKIMDPEAMLECPVGQFDAQGQLLNANEAIGEMVDLEGGQAFEGYWKNPEANAKRTRNGIVWMGDLAYRDEEGFFYFAGRDSDWMRVDGENVAAAQIEQILIRHPDVVLAVVYPVPDPIVGDRVMAAVELTADAQFDPLEFKAFIDSQNDMGTKWLPSFVRVARQMPMTQTAKVIKRLLRQERWESSDPTWMYDPKTSAYRLATSQDVDALAHEFAERGRANVLNLL